jgi:hypothetical protein
MLNWKGLGRKWSWPIRGTMVASGGRDRGRNTENLSQDYTGTSLELYGYADLVGLAHITPSFRTADMFTRVK